MKTHPPKIAKVVVGLPVEGPFDYAINHEQQKIITVGKRVRVLFNRQERAGYVVGLAQKAAFPRLNPILEILDADPVLDAPALALIEKMSAYYGCSQGEAAEAYLPQAYHRAKALPGSPARATRKRAQATFTLMHGPGLAAMWARLVKRVGAALEAGEQVIILVPETVMIKDAHAALSALHQHAMLLLDKSWTPKQEWLAWQDVRLGKYRVIIGARSAVFMPAAPLGLIVLLDEENSAFVQEQSPHYRAHEVAAMRSEIEGCDVIYASQCPSAETWHQAKKQGWALEACPSDKDAAVQLIDMTNYNPGKMSLLSFPVQSTLRKGLEERKKILLFLNRRGFSAMMRCNQCGHTILCKRCNVPLTYLYSKKALACRHCQAKEDVPKICPQCRGAYVKSLGRGIEKLESEVARMFPQARVSTYDKDTVTMPQADIVIATQAVLRHKYHYHCDIAVVLQFDSELNHFDFRSGHRAYALLVYLRGMARDKLIVQTRDVRHYSLVAAVKNNPASFYREELKARKELSLPPYAHLVAVSLRGPDEEKMWQHSQALYERLVKDVPKGITVEEPHPDARPKLRDNYWFVIMLKCKDIPKAVAWVKTFLHGFHRGKALTTVIRVDS